MKIGIFDPYLDTMSGGEKYMLSAALCLAKEHTVSLFWDLEKEVEVRSLAKHRFDFDLSPLTFSANVFTKETSLIQRLKETKKFDRILYLSDGSIPTVAAPLVIHFQSPIEWVHPSTKTYIKTRLLHGVVCNSKFTKSYIDKKFHVNSTVIYPPVQLQGIPSKHKDNVILNVGRFGINAQGSSFKKQDMLVDAFKKLVDTGLKKWELVLVLSVKDNEKEAVEKFKIICDGYPIKLIINPKNDDLWNEYKRAKLYWHASGFGEDLVHHPDRAEHFGITTVEAMGMGAMPLVINAGGQKEIVQDGENGFVWDSEEELLEKTQLLINDEKKRDELAEIGMKQIDKYSLERFCKEFSEIIK